MFSAREGLLQNLSVHPTPRDDRVDEGAFVEKLVNLGDGKLLA
jgi:hypothetical protein